MAATVRHRRSELSDNELDKNSTKIPRTISKPDTHKGGPKSMNTSDMNQRPEHEARTQPLHHVPVSVTLQERSPTTTASATSSHSLKSNSTVSKGDSVHGIRKAPAKEYNYWSQETSQFSGLGDTKSGDKDSTSKDKDTKKDTKDNVPDMEKVGNQTDEKPTKMYKIKGKMDPVEVAQNEEHKDTVIERAKEGSTTTTVEEEYEGNSKQSYQQHRRYSGADRPRCRQETGWEPNTGITQQDPQGRTETTLEKKRNDEDKKDTTSGIGFEELMIGARVLLYAVLVYYVISAHQEIKGLKERQDRLPQSYDSVSSEEIQNIQQEVQKFKVTIAAFTETAESLKSDLTFQMDRYKQMLQADVNTLKTQHESQAQVMEELTSTNVKMKYEMKEQSEKVEDLGKDIDQVQANVTAQGKAVDALNQDQKAMNKNLKTNEDAVKDIKTKLSSYQTEIQEKSEEILERMKKADIYLHNFELQMQNTSKRLKQHDKELDTAFDNLFNKKVAVIVIILMLCVNIGLMIAVYILCQNQTRLRSLAHGRHSQNDSVDSTDGAVGTSFSPVLEEIPLRPHLRPNLGVISFRREHQRLHKKLVKSVMNNLKENLDVEYCIILHNRDILTIPRCRLIVIFVEHTDRHVILEEEGDALGDCNRSTLKAVQKIGAVPVIVYDKDLGSRLLARDQLYNTKIWGVRCQTQLAKLSSSDRFFSVYEEFSEIQEQAFRKLIEYHLQ